jgi:hypothetical protein
MGVATPNRLADPVILESYVNPCNLLQEGGLFINYFNASSTLTLLAGEPVVYLNRVCIVQRSILPKKMGIVLTDWQVDALLDPTHTGDINIGDLIYWDLDANAVTRKANYSMNSTIPSTTYIEGIGAASASVPDNGFILGRAAADFLEDPAPYLDGSGDLVVAKTGSKRVRVVPIANYPVTEYTE